MDEERFRIFAERHPLRLLHLAAQRTRIEAERHLHDLDLSVGLFPYLLALYWQDGQNQRALSEITLRDPGTTVRSLDQLEARGFVERRPDPNDRRHYHVYLTRKGREIQKVLISKLLEVRRAAFAGFEASETNALVAYLEKVIDNLDGNSKQAGRDR